MKFESHFEVISSSNNRETMTISPRRPTADNGWYSLDSKTFSVYVVHCISTEKGSSEPQHASKLPIIIGVSCAAFVLIAIPTLCAVFKWNRSVKNSLLPRSNSRVGSGSAMPQEMVFRKVDYISQATRVKEQKFSLQEKIQLSEVNNGIDF